MMKRWILIAVLTVCQGMAADEFVGEYSASMPEVGTGLLLRADQSFEYFLSYGAADYSSKGTWRRDKDAVYLTTSGPESKPFRVVRTAKGVDGTVRIGVLAPNGRGVPHIDIVLTTSSGEFKSRTAEDGLATLSVKGTVKSVSIHVPVYDVDAGPFDIVPGSNDVWFEINGDAITSLRFRDEPLKLVNGALEMTYFKGDKPLRYRKR